MDRISTNKLYIDIKLMCFIDMCTLIISFKMRGHKVSVMITVNFNYMLLFGINSFKIMNKCDKSQQFLISLSSNNSKNTLQNIIEPYIYTRNDSLALFPVHQPEMSNELLRLGSFVRYPSENCPSLIRLAEAGFFYQGHGSEVKCFSCGIMNDDWQSTSVPLDVHRVISPSCKYINERFPQTHSRTVMADISASCRQKTNRQPSACISKKTQWFENKFRSVSKDIIQEQKATLDIKPEGQSSINRKLLNTSNLNNVPWQTTTLSQLKYPDYQKGEIRKDTFKKWSNSLLEDTHTMIDAGFFYTGFEDWVRCFSCGIGLRNWEADDNPWVEHARWSPKCPYLLQTKGETFIENVRFSLGLETGLENEVQTATTGELGLPLVFGDQSCDVLDSATNTVLQNVLQPSGCDVDAVHVCTDYSNKTKATLLVSSSAVPFPVKNSTDDGFIGSAPQSSLLTSSSRSNGYDSGYSSNQSASSASSSQPSSSQLPVISEELQQNVATRNVDKDCFSLIMNRNNTPKEKYPEYILIETRRATYKNWLRHFLHPLDLSECGFFYLNFGDCVRCFHCGIGLRNWELDDNPWVEHARWSRKCPYLLQRKGQEFIDSVLRVLGLQTDAEIEQQINNNGHEPSAQASSAYGTDVVGQEMFIIEDVRWRSNVNIHVHNNYNVTGQNIIVGNGTIKDAREISEESTDIQTRLQMLEKKCCIHYCYIRKFRDMKREASDSEGQRQFDFVCWYGYKIRVSAYIRCRALHFRFQVLASENDASLQWPFRTRIVFTIVDQKDQTQNITAIDKSKTDIPSFSCPQASDVSVYECNQVFPLDDFDSDRYVKGDDICIMLHIKRQLL